jgi:hypothetical protein
MRGATHDLVRLFHIDVAPVRHLNLAHQRVDLQHQQQQQHSSSRSSSSRAAAAEVVSYLYVGDAASRAGRPPRLGCHPDSCMLNGAEHYWSTPWHYRRNRLQTPSSTQCTTVDRLLHYILQLVRLNGLSWSKHCLALCPSCLQAYTAHSCVIQSHSISSPA